MKQKEHIPGNSLEWPMIQWNGLLQKSTEIVTTNLKLQKHCSNQNTFGINNTYHLGNSLNTQ
jgi:hypothetical protein